ANPGCLVFRSPKGVTPRNSRANKDAARTGSSRGVCLALVSEDELPNLELTRTKASVAHAAPQVNRSGPQCHRRPRCIVVQARRRRHSPSTQTGLTCPTLPTRGAGDARPEDSVG